METELLKTILLIATHILVFIGGFLSRKFTLTKKEKIDHSAKLQETSNKLNDALNNKYQIFTLALNNYININKNPDGNDFYKIATTGDSYFEQIRSICDSVLSENVDKNTVKNTFIPKIVETIEKILPKYYETLQEIAKKQSLNFDGKLEEKKYKSIYEVYRSRNK
ncbi:MAG: hypothetical protein KAR05_02450 [Candidatus Omnitrophica bacterium]|nr:hypothetical protein [Candidatus Omnitrophota bacterium]